MKGFSSDSSLYAFVLEPRIVYDGDVAVTVSDVTDNADNAESSDSTDNSDTNDTVTTDNLAADSLDSSESTDSQSETDNQSPEISTDQDTITGVSASADSIYDLNTYSYLTSNIDDLILSSDGDYAYAVTYSTSVVSVFSVGDDGTLSLVQSIHSSDLTDALTDGVSGVSLVAFSDDQSEVYIYSETNQTLLTFSRDTDTGELTYESVTDLSDTLGTSTLTDLQSSNGYVYATAGDSVYVFAESDDGSTLSVIDTETEGTDDVAGISGNNTLAFSGDGSTLFVSSSSGDDDVVSIFAVNDDGSLTYSGSVTGTEEYYINSLVANDDGSLVYAYQNGSDGTEVITMALNEETGEYEIIDTESVSSDVTELVLSADESTLFTFGTSVTAYTLDSDGALGDSTTMDTGDANISSGVTSVAYAADSDEIIAVTASAVSVFNYETASVDYTEGEDAVAILPSGVISDSELDALDDYNGATITVSRDDSTTTTGDSYTFLEANGLTVEDDQLLLDGEVIGTWSASEAGVTVTFSTSVTQATAQQVLRQIAYENTSDDPDVAGSSVTLDVTVEDGSGAESTLNVTLNLTDVNDAPLLSGTEQTVDYTSGDDYVTLFADASVDTVEADETVWKLVISIDGASETDELNVDGNIITLTSFSGVQQTENGVSYQVVESDGVTTVTVFLMSDADAAAETINQIQYRTTTEDRSGDVSFSLTVAETDGSTSTESLVSTVTVTAQTEENDATVITDDTTSIDYTENSGSTAIFADAVIADTETDARNSGAGNYDGVVITITTDSNDTDGDITLASDDTYTYESQQILKDGVVIATAEQTDDGLVITFTEAYQSIPTTEDVNNILDLIQYTNDADALADSSEVSLTVTDSFGNVSDALVVTLNFVNVNDDPSVSLGDLYDYGVLSRITSTDELSELTDVTDTVISESGDRLFIADSEGNVAVYSVDSDSGALSLLSLSGTDTDTGVTSLLTDDDGSHLYVIKSEVDDYGYTYSEISVYSVGEDGTLTELQVVSLTATDYAVYQAMSNFTLSDDGSYLFFTSGTSLYASQVSSDGELGDITNYSSAWSEPYIYQPTALTVSGDYLFVSTSFSSATLIAYQITDSGIEWVGYIRNGSTDSDGNTVSVSSSISDLAASADGQSLYAVTDSGVTVYEFDADSSSFLAGSTTDISNVVDIALSADGSILYVTTSDSQLIRYAISDEGTLTKIDSTDIDSDSATVQVTDDGSLLVGDSSATYYQMDDYALEVAVDGSTVLMPIIAVADADTTLSDSYAGFVFTLTTSDNGLTDGSISLDTDNGYAASEGEITYDGETVATYALSDGQWVLTITGSLTQSEVNGLLQSIRYTAREDAEVGDTVTFTLTTTDTADSEQTQSWTVDVVETVDAPVVDLDDYTLTEGQANESYSVTLPDTLVEDPAQLELSWAVDGLPDGLSFDAETQTLSGTPTTAGDYTLTFTVTNSSGEQVTFELGLTIGLSDADATPQADVGDTTVSVDSGETVAYQFAEDSVTDPQDLDLTWSVDGLPDGVSFDAETLTLSGDATTDGSYDITVTVTNTLGLSTSFTLTLSIGTTASSTAAGAASVWLTMGDAAREQAAQQQQFIAGNHLESVSGGLSSTIGTMSSLANRLSAQLEDTLVNELSVSDGQPGDTMAADVAGVSHWLDDSEMASAASSTDIWWQELHHPSSTATADGPDSGDAVSVTVSTLAGVAGGKVLTITQSDGQPLPNGATFDAQTGILSLSAAALSQLDSSVLTITVEDRSGHQHQVDLTIQPSATQTSVDHETFNQQTSQVSQQSMSLLNRIWLAELAS